MSDDKIRAIEATIGDLEEQIRILNNRLNPLWRELGKLKSRRFIQVNRITRADVQDSNALDTWFGSIRRFSEWLLANDVQKPWCVWNGVLLRTDEVKNCRELRDTDGRYEDVPE
jgi:hypothetical protein